MTRYSPSLRQQSRHAAVQSLYSWLINPIEVLKLMRQAEEESKKPFDTDYYKKLVSYATENKDTLFTLIEAHNQASFFENNSDIERAILLVGVAELLNSPEVPSPVILDQAVILAKRFGQENCHQFINAMLERISQDVRLG